MTRYSFLHAGKKEGRSATKIRTAKPSSAKKVYARWLGKSDVGGKYFGGSVSQLAQFWPELTTSPGADVTIKIASTNQTWAARWIRRGGASGAYGNGCFFGGSLSAPLALYAASLSLSLLCSTSLSDLPVLVCGVGYSLTTRHCASLLNLIGSHTACPALSTRQNRVLVSGHCCTPWGMYDEHLFPSIATSSCFSPRCYCLGNSSPG